MAMTSWKRYHRYRTFAIAAAAVIVGLAGALCGRPKTFGGTFSKIASRGQLVSTRGSGKTFAAEIDRARLLAHCARPAPCVDFAVCAFHVTMYVRVSCVVSLNRLLKGFFGFLEILLDPGKKI